MQPQNSQEALQFIYGATRLAPLTADQHEALRKAAELIAEALKPADEISKAS